MHNGKQSLCHAVVILLCFQSLDGLFLYNCLYKAVDFVR
jgi:hypothetical protein